jgi:hypothetical protein
MMERRDAKRIFESSIAIRLNRRLDDLHPPKGLYPSALSARLYSFRVYSRHPERGINLARGETSAALPITFSITSAITKRYRQ